MREELVNSVTGKFRVHLVLVTREGYMKACNGDLVEIKDIKQVREHVISCKGCKRHL